MSVVTALAATACVAALLATGSAEEFSRKSAIPEFASGLTSAPGRSETDCALRCQALGSGCSATAFVPGTLLCLLSVAWNADFSAAAPSASVYRRSWTKFPTALLMTDGRRFRIIQQRSTGSVSFARGWTEYESGFGDGAEFWIGLRSIHELTGSSPRLLRVEAVTWSNDLFVCEYSGFSVDKASTNYAMTFDSYLNGSSNTTADALTYHKGMQFSTMDRDNDVRSDSCSQAIGGFGGWWFKDCRHCNPNGFYFGSRMPNASAMFWNAVDEANSLKSIRLMLQL